MIFADSGWEPGCKKRASRMAWQSSFSQYALAEMRLTEHCLGSLNTLEFITICLEVQLMADEYEKTKVPWPKIGDHLFATSSDWWHNACLNYDCSWGLYAKGYKTGADVLVQHILDTRSGQDYIIYPIVFLYRQFIELRLKELIRQASQLVDKPKDIPMHHSILNLWIDCRKFLEEIWPEGDKKDLDAVENCIKEFSKIDPSSMSFRYPVNKEGNPSLPQNLSHINIRHLGEVMQGIANLLDGCDLGIDAMLDDKAEMYSYMSDY